MAIIAQKWADDTQCDAVGKVGHAWHGRARHTDVLVLRSRYDFRHAAAGKPRHVLLAWSPGNALDDIQRHVDIATGSVRVGANLMRCGHQFFCCLLVQAGQGDIMLHLDAKAVRDRANAHF